jgi:hypothetical protein
MSVGAMVAGISRQFDSGGSTLCGGMKALRNAAAKQVRRL